MFGERFVKVYNHLLRYPDRESNSELSFRRALLYPFNYQGHISAAKLQLFAEKCVTLHQKF